MQDYKPNKDLIDVLLKFRKSDYLKEKEELCELLSLPDEIKNKIDCADIEALLLKASKDALPGQSIELDIALMSFGLLKGYRHESHQQSVPQGLNATERRKKFLRESDYLQHHYKGEKFKFASYEEVEKAGRVDDLVNNLLHREETPISKIATIIAGQTDQAAYIKAAVSEYKHGCKDFILDEYLPRLANQREESVPPKGETKRKMEPFRHFLKIISLATAIIVLLFVAAMKLINFAVERSIAAAISVQNVREPGFELENAESASFPPVEEIDVGALEITMTPGKTLHFTPEVDPDAARGTALSYSSSNPQIAAAYGELNNTQCRIKIPERERLGPLPASADITVTAPSWVSGTVEVKVVESVAPPEDVNGSDNNETPVALDEEGPR